MDDLISRQAAIDEIDVLCQEHRYKIPGKVETYSQYNEAWQDALDRAEGAIGNLPSAQPERMRGRWINEGVYGEGHSQCSIRCNNPLCNFHYIGYLGDYNFCPNCGAEMKKGEE